MKRKDYIILALLFFAVIVNMVLHVTHPAYKEYKRAREELQTEFENLKRDSVQPLVFAITNSINKCSTWNNSDTDIKPSLLNSLTGSSDNKVSSKDSPLPNVPSLSFGYFSACGEDYMVYQGRNYRLGDSFLGSELTFISPTFISTRSMSFCLKGSN